ncbi:MAG: hypothetical protein M3132_10355 [Actinomycetia bacterium]|nr:hypothetical protein [Actinomycetes bacterium]
MNIAAWMPFFVIGFAILGVAVWHLATHDVPYMPKWAWVLFMIFTIPIGAIVYISVVMFGAGTKRDDAEGRPAD